MKYFLISLCLFYHVVGNTTIRLPAILSSNMVLQQQAEVKLWGWGSPAEKVFVSTTWNQVIDSTVVDGNAKWQLNIHTPAAGGPYTITIKGENTIQLQNVLIGEVWICSGQSNMEFNYNWGLPQMKADLPNIANQNIRFFQVLRTTAAAPQEDLHGEWLPCDSSTVKSFSAVGFYFGRKLNSDLKVPIGLINASWGGTPAEAWTPSEEVNKNEILQHAASQLNTSKWWPTIPGRAYNGMIAPLTNYSIAGSIWYQGESNTGTASTYQQLFTAMISAWRTAWKNMFPFYFVQIAPFNYGNNNLAALLREAQEKTLTLSGTGMIVTTDLVDDTLDIHPKNKKEVGVRLANLALIKTYGKIIPGVMSPVYKDMIVNGNTVTLTFQPITAGLMARGKTINGFFVAGADHVFSPAQAKISGNTIMVWNKMIAHPEAVRYAFSNTAIGNIFSKEGLPLAPFRTDSWEENTKALQ